MSGMMPKFLEGEEIRADYYDKPAPYRDAPSCNVDLLALSRYAKKVGKKLVELTREEVRQFGI